MKREEIRRTGGKKRGFHGTIDEQRWIIKESGLSWCILSLSVLVVKRRATRHYVLFSRRGVCWNFVARKLWLEKEFLWNFPQVLMWIPPLLYEYQKKKKNWIGNCGNIWMTSPPSQHIQYEGVHTVSREQCMGWDES